MLVKSKLQKHKIFFIGKKKEGQANVLKALTEKEEEILTKQLAIVKTQTHEIRKNPKI